MIYRFILDISLEDNISWMEQHLNRISAERQERIKKYRFEKDKIRSFFSELLVKYTLMEKYNLSESNIYFALDKFGKPILKNSDIHFNISHSGDRVICGVGDSAIGIDIEMIRKLDYKSIYMKFSADEIASLELLDETEQLDRFYRIWTLKESYVKYTGLGLRCPFNSFSFNISDTDDISLIENGLVNDNVTFSESRLDGKYWYSMCMESSEKAADAEFLMASNIISYFG